jgi:hypothetical protein
LAPSGPSIGESTFHYDQLKITDLLNFKAFIMRCLYVSVNDFIIIPNSKIFPGITRTTIPMNIKIVKGQNWPMNIILEKVFPDKVEGIFIIPSLVIFTSKFCMQKIN